MKKLKLVSMLLVVVMLLAMIPLGIMPTSAAEAIERDEKWYATETKDTDPDVLHIKDAEDLLAFAWELNNGANTDEEITGSKDFSGYVGNIFYNKTIVLDADIILNEGWDAMAVDPFAGTDQAPATVWPVESERYFAGTFDGQGHVISGLYQSYLGKYVGLFGNVKGGTTATVKNLIILNSYIQGSAEGIGSIFGVVYLRPRCLSASETSWQKSTSGKDQTFEYKYMTDIDAHSETKGTIENVYVNSKVVSTGTGRTHTGSAGFVGGNNSDLFITNSAWTGEVIGGVRGVAGAVGQIRSLEHKTDTGATEADLKELLKQPGYEAWDESDVAANIQSDGWGYYLEGENTHTVLTNLYMAGNLVGYNGIEYPTNPQSFVGGVIGYVNNAGDRIVMENVISNSTMDTRVYTAEGNKVYKNYKDSMQGVETFDALCYSGYIYGGNWGSINHLHPHPFSEWTYQQWYVDNVTYVETPYKVDGVVDPAKGIIYGAAVGYFNGDTKYYFEDSYLDEDLYALFSKKPVDTTDAILTDIDWNEDGITKDYELLQYQFETYKGSGKDKFWTFQALGLDGELLVDGDGGVIDMLATNKAGKDLAESHAKWMINTLTFKTLCAVSEEDLNWDDVLYDRGYENWEVVNDMPMPSSLAEIVKAKEAADIPAAEPEADDTWYSNQADATTLMIYNADDLLAFQAKIAEGETFEGKTIVIANSFKMNADMAAETLFEVEDLTGKEFKGTIDGRNNTISGLYLDAAGDTGLFGNAAGTAAVKNLKIENSIIKSTGAVGVLFGNATDATVSNVWIDATVSGAGNVGGIAAKAEKLTVTNAIIGGTITASAGNAGAVVGEATGAATVTDVLVTATAANAFAGAGTVTVKNALITSTAAKADGTNVFVVGTDVEANDLIGKAGDAFLTEKGMNETWTAIGMNPMPKAVYENFYEGLVGYSISIGQKLSVNIYVKLDAAASVKGTFKVGGGKETEVFSEVQENGQHKFVYENLDPAKMGDEILFTSEGYSYTTTVKNYLVALLNVNPELASAVLRWGAAAQTFTEYKTDALVTDGVEGMTEATNTWEGVTNDATYTGTESALYKVIGTTLVVSEEGILKVNVKVRFQDISGRQCLTGITGERAEINLNYAQIDIVETENRTYQVIYSNLDIASMNDPIKLVLKDKPNGTELSQTLTTTLNGIIADFMASDADQTEKDLAAAMHAVGVALNAAK